MLSARAAGRLDLPMTGHAYLYAVLAGMADKVEAVAERQAEAERRTGPRQDTVQVRGQTLPIGEALRVVYAGKDPALAAMDAHEQHVAPMPTPARELLAKLKGNKP